jgi:hypothetical protein
MITNNAYEYLKYYLLQRKKYNDIADNGVEILLIILETKFNYKFNLNYHADNLKDAISIKYKDTPDDTLKNIIFEREYFYLAYKNRIDPILLFNQLNKVSKDYKALNNNHYDHDGYEITHLILAILFTKSKNNINFIKIENILIDLINKNIHSDLKTEALYILCLINPSKIRQVWIDELNSEQNMLGYLDCTYFGNYDDAIAHHTALGLLVYSEYKKYCFLRSIKLIPILLIFYKLNKYMT